MLALSVEASTTLRGELRVGPAVDGAPQAADAWRMIPLTPMGRKRMDDEPIEIAWNDHIAAFEVLAVATDRLVADGVDPGEAFQRVLVRFQLPDAFRDKYWRIAVPVIIEHALQEGTTPSLVGADLAGIDLEEGDLRGFDLSGADLSGAFLAGAQLDGANLTGANLAGADLDRASLSGATLPDGSIHG
jgi:hypothetical protein